MKSSSHSRLHPHRAALASDPSARPFAMPIGGLLSLLATCIGSLVVACGNGEDAAAPSPSDTREEVPMFGQPSPTPQVTPPVVMSMAPAPEPGPEGPSAPEEQMLDDLPVAPAAEASESPTPESPEGETTEPDMTDGEETPADPEDDPEEQPPAGELPPITIWIAGDSTVANGNTPCPRGWGGAFAPHFDERVTVRNSAVGGRSVHTWLYDVQTVMDANGECVLTRDANGEPVLQARWQEMLDNMKSGDYLFMQFGINDGDPSCNRHVGIEAFKATYGMMALAAKERGARPVFLTPVSSISCNGTQARGSRGGFVPATLEVGAEFDVPVIDLHARSVELFQSLAFCPVAGGDVSAQTTGPVGDFFCDDHTHFSSAGAVAVGDLVVEALREQSLPLATYLR